MQSLQDRLGYFTYNSLAGREKLEELEIGAVLRALKQQKVKIHRKRLSKPYYLKYHINLYFLGPYNNAGIFNLFKVVFKKDRRKKLKQNY